MYFPGLYKNLDETIRDFAYMFCKQPQDEQSKVLLKINKL